MPRIIDVATVDTLTDSDSLFVNSSGSLRQIAMSDISASGGMMDLLWENPNPTSAFESQEIPVDIDVDEYDTVVFVVADTNTANYQQEVSCSARAGKNGQATITGYYDSRAGVAYRNFTYGANSPKRYTVSSCRVFDDTRNSQNNAYCIPLAVYGTRSNLTSLIPPSVKIDKLWTNPDPTAQFAAQTINLDLSEYDAVEVRYVGSTVWKSNSSVTISKGNRGYANVTAGNMGMQSASNTVIYTANRLFTVSDTGIECSAGYAMTSNGSIVSPENRAGVPTEIYGIKIETTPIVSGITMELLWENASPASEFAAQTMSCNMGDYDIYLVQFNYEKQVMATALIDKGLSTNVFGSAAYTSERAITINDNNFVVDDACYFQSGWQKNNTLMVPYKIYGIKGVR